MLSGGFMVPTPQFRVPSSSILQKPLSFSQDLVLQAVVRTYTHLPCADGLTPPLEDLLLTFHPSDRLFIVLHSLSQLGLLQVFYFEFC